MRRLLVFILLLFSTLPVYAETPSQVTNPKKANNSWVADEANVLTENNEARINRFITQLEKQTGTEIAVVTVHNLSGQSVEAWSNQLFELWGIGKKDKDNGVLFVAAIDDRKMRIEVGYGFEDKINDSKAGAILNEQAKPYFRNGDYDNGVWNVVQAIGVAIQPAPAQPKSAASKTGKPSGFASKPPAPASGQNSPNRSYVPPSNSNPGSPIYSSDPSPSSSSFPWAFLAIPAVGLVGLGVWFSTRPQKCETCDIEMNQMPEGAEDEFLTEEQEFEQRLGSVDWAVWKCPKCAKNRIIPHAKFFSSYHQCPRCRNRTAANNSRTLSYATYDSNGLEEVTERCEWPKCRYTNTYRRTIPQKVRPAPSSHSSSHSRSSGSSSRSSGSFGGGRSGGGGASSSW